MGTFQGHIVGVLGAGALVAVLASAAGEALSGGTSAAAGVTSPRHTDPGAVTHVTPSASQEASPKAATAAARQSDSEASASVCPDGTVHVKGSYCTDVRHTCKEWLDDPKLPFARCKSYEQKARCVGERVQLEFCIDRDEYTAPGDDKPLNFQSYAKATQVCQQRGMRTCREKEWNFACEGEEMLPYPYGWEREPVCNQDRPNDTLFIQKPGKTVLADHRMASGANPQCTSPFGVRDMVGNLDEPVLRLEHNYPFRNALKGGWWMAARNRCRPATTAHDDHYQDIQVGVRCCADVEGSDSSAKG